MKKQAVVINVKDNVATLVDDFKVGTEIHYFIGEREESVVLLQDIPLGHKVAIRDIRKGEEVTKYGESLGAAIEDIKTGRHVHVHNLESLRGRGDK